MNQTEKSATVPIEVWDEIKTKHLEGFGFRYLARKYLLSEGAISSYAFRHRWSNEASEYKKICPDHHHRFRSCPNNCLHAFIWKHNIELAKRRRIRKSKARQAQKRKAQRALPKPPPIIKTCKYCQNPLPKWHKLFCSAPCRKGHKKAKKPQVKKGRPKKPNPPRKCAQCLCDFTTPQPSSKGRFCSKPCFYSSMKKAKPPPVERSCITCATPILFPKTKFCSRKCCKKHQKIVDKKLGRKHKHKPKPRKVIPIKSCAICANEFQPKSPKHLFCSRKCRLKKQRKNKRIKDKGKAHKPHQRIKRNLSKRLRDLLLKKGQQKQNAIRAYMGCTPKEMVTHVESQFTDGMNWGNYGVHGWHLDHIIPCARFNLTNEDHCKVCFNWRNIRPLWGKKNYMRQDMLTLDEALSLDPELVKMAKDVGVRLWQ